MKSTTQNMISKDQSYIIKGFAILLMLVHHFYTFPSWIITGGGYAPNLRFATLFNSPTKLCVCIFAFINGWTFAFKNVSSKEALLKIKKLLFNYWCIAIPALIVAIIICGNSISPLTISKELLGLSSYVMIFAWYVPFYCVSIIVLVPLQKLMSKSAEIGVVVGVILPIIIFTVLKKLPLGGEIETLFNNLKHWFPCITVGFMSYKYRWLEKIDRYLGRVNKYVVSIFLIIVCFIGRYYIPALDFVYCLFLVYAIANLEINVESMVGRIISRCGKSSSNMWFLHCLYFGKATRELIQPLAFFANNPVLIYIIAVFELIVLSELIELIKSRVYHNKLNR